LERPAEYSLEECHPGERLLHANHLEGSDLPAHRHRDQRDAQWRSGKIVASGGPELALELEDTGYDRFAQAAA
jgi:hypothetical protein